jgi:hypothetical protein
VAAAIKKVKPHLPIVMLAWDVDLPDDASHAVDALVAKSDGPISLFETVHSVLNGKPALRDEKSLLPEPSVNPCYRRRSWDGVERRRAILAQMAIDGNDLPFSRKVWRGIRNGTLHF